jgi:thymidylate synthase
MFDHFRRPVTGKLTNLFMDLGQVPNKLQLNIQEGELMTEHIQTGYLNNDFRTCLAQLMEYGMVAHPRGTTTRELLNYNITLQSARNRVITFPERNTNTKYLLGEFIWYLTGSNDPKGILPYSKFWANITNSGDVAGYEKGTINSNYGHRLFGHDERMNVSGLSQWNSTVELLKKDKDSRQAIMNIHMPADRHDGNKDVPCTLTLHWFIRENKLHMICNMRSNDIILGFTNDVFQFTMLQECMQVQLKEMYPDLGLGHYFHNAGSMHIYDRHFEMAEKIIANEKAFDLEMIPMDRFDDEILTGLAGVEAAWQAAGAPDDFDFEAVGAFAMLSPYWQTCVKALLGKDEEAMHALFGQED